MRSVNWLEVLDLGHWSGVLEKLAVLGIVSFALAMRPYTLYYQTPMVIIGKVYANSMLVLINSWMLLGPEEM
jgi:hypothetical protein